MSAYHEIFVRTDRATEQFLSDVAAAIGVPIDPIADEINEYIDYAGQIEHAAIEIEMTHEFEEDYGIPFEQYPIDITVRDFGSDKQREEALARDIFGKLCQRGYSLLLVFNLARLLDRCGE